MVEAIYSSSNSANRSTGHRRDQPAQGRRCSIESEGPDGDVRMVTGKRGIPREKTSRRTARGPRAIPVEKRTKGDIIRTDLLMRIVECAAGRAGR